MFGPKCTFVVFKWPVLYRTGKVCGALQQALTIYKTRNYPKAKRGKNDPQN